MKKNYLKQLIWQKVRKDYQNKFKSRINKIILNNKIAILKHFNPRWGLLINSKVK